MMGSYSLRLLIVLAYELLGMRILLIGADIS